MDPLCLPPTIKSRWISVTILITNTTRKPTKKHAAVCEFIPHAYLYNYPGMIFIKPSFLSGYLLGNVNDTSIIDVGLFYNDVWAYKVCMPGPLGT